jgi:hypothetical protein
MNLDAPLDGLLQQGFDCFIPREREKRRMYYEIVAASAYCFPEQLFMLFSTKNEIIAPKCNRPRLRCSNCGIFFWCGERDIGLRRSLLCSS